MKYLSETSKSFRYDKIQKAIEEKIIDLAERYREEWGRYRCDDEHEGYISCEQLETESYDHAAEELLGRIDEAIGDDDLYYIIDIMIHESFGTPVDSRNPYKVTKKEQKEGFAVESTPYGIMVKIK